MTLGIKKSMLGIAFALAFSIIAAGCTSDNQPGNDTINENSSPVEAVQENQAIQETLPSNPLIGKWELIESNVDNPDDPSGGQMVAEWKEDGFVYGEHGGVDFKVNYIINDNLYVVAHVEPLEAEVWEIEFINKDHWKAELIGDTDNGAFSMEKLLEEMKEHGFNNVSVDGDVVIVEWKRIS